MNDDSLEEMTALAEDIGEQLPEEPVPEEAEQPQEEPAMQEETVEQEICEQLPLEEAQPPDERLEELGNEIKSEIAAAREDTAALGRLLRQYIKENVEYREQVRGRMEKKIEEYQKKESGDVFNPILKEIAQVYSDYMPLFEEEELSDRARGNLDSLFEQLEDILLDYDARVCRTSVGEKREMPRMSKIARQIPTDDESLVGTVAFNRKPGIVKNERMVLTHELVDIYVYEPSEKEDSNEIIEEEN